MRLAILAALTGCGAVFAANLPNETQYFTDVAAVLQLNNLGTFLRGLELASALPSGQALLDTLYSGKDLTIFGPVDQAWPAVPQTADESFVQLLSYHVATAHIDPSSIAPPRYHTVALTLLSSGAVSLANGQQQVTVLERAPADPGSSNGTYLIRGDTWNATAVGSNTTIYNLAVQPIDKILRIPLPFEQTLVESGLATSAPLGAPGLIYASTLAGNLDQLTACVGCTYFAPVNIDLQGFAALAVANLSLAQHVVLNHVINGSVIYSPQFNGTNVTVPTAAGEPLSVWSNDTGRYVQLNGSVSQIVRADLAVAQGVVHLISNAFADQAYDEYQVAHYQSIISSAAGVPVSVTGAAVTMTTPTSSFTFSAATSVPVSSPSSAPSDLAVRRISEGASFTFFALVGSMLLI